LIQSGWVAETFDFVQFPFAAEVRFLKGDGDAQQTE
jgi:hypothetical protein